MGVCMGVTSLHGGVAIRAHLATPPCSDVTAGEAALAVAADGKHLL